MARYMIVLLLIFLLFVCGCELFEEDEVTYDYPTITKIKVTKIPDVNDFGSAWDEFSSPDVFCQVIDTLSNTYYTSSTKQDVISDDFPLTFKPDDLELLDPDREFLIAIWDEDISSNDLIGVVGPFSAQLIMDDSVHVHTMFNHTWTLEVSVTLMW